ncbi:MAG: hypothetical protein ACPGQL_00450 [Thermoplasmatota archaeon]
MHKLIAFLMVSVALAGCTGGGQGNGGDDGHDHGDHAHGGNVPDDLGEPFEAPDEFPGRETDGPDPATLPVPEWRAGDYWNFTYGEAWVRYLVLGEETRDGKAVYRVNVTRGPGPASMGNVAFAEKDNLGVVGIEQNGFNVTFGCALGRLLPVMDDERSCDGPFGYGQVNETRFVEGWHTFETPRGDVDGVLVTIITDDGRTVRQARTWYAPDVGYRLAFMEPTGETFVLSDWNWQAGDA